MVDEFSIRYREDIPISQTAVSFTVTATNKFKITRKSRSTIYRD